MKSRETPGTLADVARRALEKDVKYRALEKTLQGMFILEAVMKHGGRCGRAAQSIGVTRHTVQRTLKSIGISGADIRAIARRSEGRSDGGNA